MKKSEQLFYLIKSLKPPEVRYFKRYVAAGEAVNYLRIFDAMAAQEMYDEPALKAQFEGEAFIRQFHVAKNYLRTQLLRSLRNYHHQHSRAAQIWDQIREVEILYHRELYPLCEDMLKRMEKRVSEGELFPEWLKILEWKQKIWQAQYPQDIIGLRRILEEKKQVLNHLNNLQTYWHLVTGMEQEDATDWLSDSTKALSLRAKVLYYNIQYSQRLRGGDSRGARQALEELLSWLEAHPHKWKENPTHYLNTANNLLSYLIFEKQYTEAEAWLGKVKATYMGIAEAQRGKSLLKLMLRTYNIELEMYRDKGDYEGAGPFMEELTYFLREHTRRVPDAYRISFHFQFSYIYFQQGNYRAALKWINEILQNPQEGIREDLQVQARFLNLMIHLERRNFFVLRYYVDSTRRYLKKLRRVEEYEQTLLKFFTQIGRVPESEFMDLYHQLAIDLFQEGPAQIPRSLLGYIDYRSWLEKKRSKSI